MTFRALVRRDAPAPFILLLLALRGAAGARPDGRGRAAGADASTLDELRRHARVRAARRPPAHDHARHHAGEDPGARSQSLVDYSWGTLILFEASDREIDRIGGIAAGMSGSPVYVDDGGVDKLVGALSYGDWFTLDGMGLATPIEYMAAIEADYPSARSRRSEAPRPPAPAPTRSTSPCRPASGVVRSVVVARSAKRGAAVDGGERARP